jgi:glycosyltransferase involved in cell wall biosynthesis
MTERALHALLVDPSLYTAPYDAALDAGLAAAGVHTRWAIRPPRSGQPREIEPARADEFFYRRVDDAAALPALLRPLAKGLAHVAGLAGLVMRVRRQRPDVVHFQWTVVPLLDSLAIACIRRWCPVVLTVHDTTPYNGERPFFGAVLGFDWPMRLADALIVHTRAGHAALVARGVPAAKLRVVPHGPLALKARPTPGRQPRDPRWTFVAFGEMKPYKGLDLLVEATGRLAPALRQRLRVVIAGRARMDLEPLHARIAALGLQEVIELTDRRLSEQEMADLFDHTDTFVFPYRQIDASGVFFLVRPLGRWMIASRVGIFAEALRTAAAAGFPDAPVPSAGGTPAGAEGVLVPPQDIDALAQALADAVQRRPVAAPLAAEEGWEAIGRATLRLYREVAPRVGGAALLSGRPQP